MKLGRDISAGALVLLVLACGLVAAPPAKVPVAPKGKPAAEPVIENAWPKLSADEQASALDDLKKFADQCGTKLDRPLKLFETKYFLFYSDLPQQEAKNWAGLLDKMYAKLAETFAVAKGENIWRGKGLVFVFARREDYRRYEREMAGVDPGESAGMCQSFSDGLVKIAFYRQPQELVFAHVLVHESVHGFIHRYRTPVRVPSWANEGLAETIATELVPQPGRREQVKAMAAGELRQHGNRMEDFFDAEHIDAWQYPVAEMMCTFMIQADKHKYVDFIKGIKDGMSVDDCLAAKFKAPRERLVPVFGQWLGVGRVQ